MKEGILLKYRFSVVLIMLCIITVMKYTVTVYAGSADTVKDEDKRNISSNQENYSYRDADYRYPDINEFTAETLDRGAFTQDDLKEYDLTILYFWSGTCGYCVNELQDLALLKEDLPSNVQIITFCADAEESPDMIGKIMDRRGLDVVTIVSGDGDLEKLSSELFFTPTVLFLDSEGYQVRKPYMGTPDDLVEEYNMMIDEVLEIMGKERAKTLQDNDN